MPRHPSSDDWPIAATDLFEKYHEQVLVRLKAAYPSADMDLRHDAFVQALLEVVRKELDPARGRWVDFLTGAAKRALRTLVRSAKARREREMEHGKNLVADRESAARDIVDMLADAELVKKIQAEVAQTEEERIVLGHWGEDFRGIARALNITHLGEDEQQRRVKELRDRLSIRLRRRKGKP